MNKIANRLSIPFLLLVVTASLDVLAAGSEPTEGQRLLTLEDAK